MNSWDDADRPGGWDAPREQPAPETAQVILKGVRHIGKGSGLYEPTGGASGRAERISATEETLPPIGGWLLAFVVVRVFVGPIWMVALAALEWWWLDSIYELQLGILATYPGLVYATMADIVVGTIVTAYAAYAGVIVWRQRIHAVAVARSSLVVSIAFALFQAVLPFVATLPPDLTFWLTIIRGIACFVTVTGLAGWYAYFRLSERVARSLPRAGTGQVQKLEL